MLKKIPLLFLCSVFSIALFAQSPDIAPSLQAAVYKKLLSMDKLVASKGRGKIIIVTEKMTPPQYELSKSFEEVGLMVEVVKTDAFPDNFSTFSAVYLTTANTVLANKCAEAQVLVIGAGSGLVESGSAGLSLANIDGKVKPVISESFVNRSGHTGLLAALSKTANIIK